MTQNSHPLRNLSLGCILEIFLKFCEFQPRYSYKIYPYRKKECISADLNGLKKEIK